MAFGQWGGGEPCVSTMRRKQIYANPFLQGVQEGGRRRAAIGTEERRVIKVVIGALRVGQELGTVQNRDGNGCDWCRRRREKSCDRCRRRREKRCD